MGMAHSAYFRICYASNIYSNPLCCAQLGIGDHYFFYSHKAGYASAIEKSNEVDEENAKASAVDG
jgi:hypothetical protein